MRVFFQSPLSEKVCNQRFLCPNKLQSTPHSHMAQIAMAGKTNKNTSVSQMLFFSPLLFATLVTRPINIKFEVQNQPASLLACLTQLKMLYFTRLAIAHAGVHIHIHTRRPVHRHADTGLLIVISTQYFCLLCTSAIIN